MKFIYTLVFLAVVGFVSWPYMHIYRLSYITADNNKSALESLVDFGNVRRINKQDIEWQVNNVVGGDKNLLSNMMRQGAKVLGDAAVDQVIDSDWLLQRLHQYKTSVWQAVTFAFFESPTSFTIRIGELGRRPLHVQMTLRDWFWKVTAVYN